MRDAGLDHLVTVRPDDYRDLDGTFDKVVAIEMIEAVDWREYDTFFAHCRSLLSDSGLLAMQAIVVPDASFDRTKHTTDFIKAAIFPGGCLPSVGALDRGGATAGGGAGLGSCTSTTSACTTPRRCGAGGPTSSRARAELLSFGFDERFTRLWEFYFSYCEAGFDERYISVVQLAYAAPGWVVGGDRPPTARRARSRALGDRRRRASLDAALELPVAPSFTKIGYDDPTEALPLDGPRRVRPHGAGRRGDRLRPRGSAGRPPSSSPATAPRSSCSAATRPSRDRVVAELRDGDGERPHQLGHRRHGRPTRCSTRPTQILAEHDRLDVLVHNAGALTNERQEPRTASS